MQSDILIDTDIRHHRIQSMKLSAEEHDQLSFKPVTVMGMSGLGKTTLAEKLKSSRWYHYSADYRIGTAYLNKPIIDDLYNQIEHIPAVKDLLDSGSIKLQNNITINNLKPLSAFLGLLGNPEQGGLALGEFSKRQTLYYEAEIAAMNDVTGFLKRAETEGYKSFMNDSTGSLCEIEDENVFRLLAEHTILIYIEATKDDEEELLERAKAYPKPLFFPPSFLEQALERYCQLKEIDYVALINPVEFSRWVFPELFHARLPKYKQIAEKYGYTISNALIRQIESAEDFVVLVKDVMKRDERCLS